MPEVICKLPGRDMCEAMDPQRVVQRSRFAQVGFLMRSYRESFRWEDGSRGMTQEQVLRRMAEVDGDYGERTSHATVSRWESGSTRPTAERLKTFGQALNLSNTEVAGLILLAGLVPDFPSASGAVNSAGSLPEENDEEPAGVESERPSRKVRAKYALDGLGRFLMFRFLLPALVIVAVGYGLSFIGWNGSWMQVAYIAVVLGMVMVQGLVVPDRAARLRDFFWVSLFFVLTAPALQFAPLQRDIFNFHMVPGFYDTHLPCMLCLLTNLALASTAAVMFQTLWKWQYAGDASDGSASSRVAWVVLPPTALVYAVVVVISNISVSIQLAVVMPVLAGVFMALLAIRDPAVRPSAQDRRFFLIATFIVAVVSSTLGAVAILAVFLAPELPGVLPDHNLLKSWDIDVNQWGHTQEEVHRMLNLGYVWHALCLFAYMVFIVGGNLLVAVYRMDGADTTGPDATHEEGLELAVSADGIDGLRFGSWRRRPVLSSAGGDY